MTVALSINRKEEVKMGDLSPLGYKGPPVI